MNVSDFLPPELVNAMSLSTPTKHDTEALRKRWEDDPVGFEEDLRLELLRPVVTWSSGAEVRDPKAVAAMLRACGASLEDLGIPWKPENKSKSAAIFGDDSDLWRYLLGCLHSAAKDDALVIFDALAESIRGKERFRVAELLPIALNQPEWRVDAIRKYPEIFRAGKKPDLKPVHERRMNSNEEKTNAFYLLATLPLERPGEGEASTWETLNALREIGVPHLRRDDWRDSMVAVAARNRDAASLKAFVKFFPEDADRPNLLMERPLGYAAEEGLADNVNVLLDAGADPHARGKMGDSALDIACRKNRRDTLSLDVVKVLLDRCSFSNEEFDRAETWVQSTRSAELKALLDAGRAKQIINQMPQQPSIRPL